MIFKLITFRELNLIWLSSLGIEMEVEEFFETDLIELNLLLDFLSAWKHLL
jgi:hypothetical protein